MLKRLMDIVISFTGLVIISPLLLLFILSIWLYDFHNPFYIAKRVGKNGLFFKMIKLRSMKIEADKTGIVSTSSDDDRITPIGKVIRKLKFDELSQLINVFVGSMTLVGPRPQVQDDVKLYTNKEKTLLKAQPGITDYSSIVFSDEGEILKGSDDPNKDYNLLIRPWKSRLGLFYIENQNFFLDIKLIIFTIISFFNKNWVLKKISIDIKKKNVSPELVSIVLRKEKLRPATPPE